MPSNWMHTSGPGFAHHISKEQLSSDFSPSHDVEAKRVNVVLQGTTVVRFFTISCRGQARKCKCGLLGLLIVRVPSQRRRSIHFLTTIGFLPIVRGRYTQDIVGIVTILHEPQSKMTLPHIPSAALVETIETADESGFACCLRYPCSGHG
jgi:hypothetical protein